MDYPEINIPTAGRERTSFYQKKPGPYDDWVVEYSYSDGLTDPADEAERLAAIAAHSTDPGLAYGNDADDMRAPGKAIDPRVNVNDMSSDAIGYAEARLAMLADLLANLRSRSTRSGESYQELVNSYLTLISQLNRQVTTITRYIGGLMVNRAMVDQAGADTPYVPIDTESQRRAMQILTDRLFSPSAFVASSDLYAHLQRQRRLFDFFSATEDPKLHDWLLTVQKRALDQLLHPTVLKRITDTRLYGNGYALTDLMEDLTDAIFDEDLRGDVGTFRQNLQLEYVNRLTQFITGENKDRYDYPSQSMALYQLRQIRRMLDGKRGGNLETRAHSENIVFTIEAALDTAARRG